MNEGRYTFDAFVLDCAAGELRREAETIELRPKVYSLLVFLLENHGRLILKEELLDSLWGDVHVGEGSLNRTVTDLRHALGDDPREPRLIETVPRRGYKFIGNVTELGTRAPDRLSEFVLIFSDRVMPLRAGENVIGRTPECDVQIIGPSVSRRHARLVISAQGAVLEDLGSMNGTYVGDRRISASTKVQDGDEIRIGKERIRLIADRSVRARTEPAL
jgi:DNA-binding winged helix-turn-helix (wHTH) protein